MPGHGLAAVAALMLAFAPAPGIGAGPAGAEGAPVPVPVFQSQPLPRHVYSGGWEHFVGGGVAAFDCDGDRLPELYMAGGEAPSTLFRNRSEPGGRLDLVARTPPALALTGVTGAYPLDIDSDGVMDLAILRVGENRLMRGLGDCAFAPMDVPGFDGRDRWTTAFSATWEAGQRWPSMAFGNYVNRDDPAGPFEACDDNDLFRAEADRLRHVILSPGYCALSMLFSDWSGRGRAALRISNDRHYYVAAGEEQMWAMESAPRLLGDADGWRHYKLWGMGIASRDLTGDGRPEVLMSSMGDQRLQIHTGPGATWQDAPFEMGTTAHRPYLGGDGRPSTGWHVAFGDVNNDGHDDIFIAKGNVEQMPDAAMDDPNNLLVQDRQGHFTEMGDKAGIASLKRARGAALVDMNGDGLLDLAVVNRRAPAELWRNVTPRGAVGEGAGAGAWVAIALHQPAPNVNAVGAFIELRAQGRSWLREVTVGGGHAGGAAVPEHFGLGRADGAQLRVTWPDGTVSGWAEVPLNRVVDVTRTGDGIAVAAGGIPARQP